MATNNTDNIIFQYLKDMSIENFKNVYNTLVVEVAKGGFFNYIINPHLKYTNNNKLYGYTYPDNSITIATSYTQVVLNNNEALQQKLYTPISDDQFSVGLTYKSNKDFKLKLESDDPIFIDDSGNNVSSLEITVPATTTDKFEDVSTTFDVGVTDFSDNNTKLSLIAIEDNTILKIKEIVFKKGQLFVSDTARDSHFVSNTSYKPLPKPLLTKEDLDNIDLTLPGWTLTHDGENYGEIITTDARGYRRLRDFLDDFMFAAVRDNVEKGIDVEYNKDKHKLDFTVNLGPLDACPALKKLAKYDTVSMNVQKSGQDIIDVVYDTYGAPIIVKYGDGSHVKLIHDIDFFKTTGKFRYLTLTWYDFIGNIYEQWQFTYDSSGDLIDSITLTDLDDYAAFSILPINEMPLWQLSFNVNNSIKDLKNIQYDALSRPVEVTYDTCKKLRFKYKDSSRALIETLELYDCTNPETLKESWLFSYDTDDRLTTIVCTYNDNRHHISRHVDKDNMFDANVMNSGYKDNNVTRRYKLNDDYYIVEAVDFSDNTSAELRYRLIKISLGSNVTSLMNTLDFYYFRDPASKVIELQEFKYSDNADLTETKRYLNFTDDSRSLLLSTLNVLKSGLNIVDVKYTIFDKKPVSIKLPTEITYSDNSKCEIHYRNVFDTNDTRPHKIDHIVFRKVNGDIEQIMLFYYDNTEEQVQGYITLRDSSFTADDDLAPPRDNLYIRESNTIADVDTLSHNVLFAGLKITDIEYTSISTSTKTASHPSVIYYERGFKCEITYKILSIDLFENNTLELVVFDTIVFKDSDNNILETNTFTYDTYGNCINISRDISDNTILLDSGMLSQNVLTSGKTIANVSYQASQSLSTSEFVNEIHLDNNYYYKTYIDDNNFNYSRIEFRDPSGNILRTYNFNYDNGYISSIIRS